MISARCVARDLHTIAPVATCAYVLEAPLIAIIIIIIIIIIIMTTTIMSLNVAGNLSR